MDNAAADGSLGAAVEAVGASVSLGVATAEALVLLLDGLELVCTPPVLWTTPERGSGVAVPLGEEVELVWALTELGAIPDFEPDEESAAEADEVVDDVGPVDDVLAPESDDELDVDDGESDDELEELESLGSASATPGVFAAAAPRPRMTANTPTRTMYFALTDIALFLATRLSANDSPSHPV